MGSAESSTCKTSAPYPLWQDRCWVGRPTWYIGVREAANVHHIRERASLSIFSAETCRHSICEYLRWTARPDLRSDLVGLQTPFRTRNSLNTLGRVRAIQMNQRSWWHRCPGSAWNPPRMLGIESLAPWASSLRSHLMRPDQPHDLRNRGALAVQEEGEAKDLGGHPGTGQSSYQQEQDSQPNLP